MKLVTLIQLDLLHNQPHAMQANAWPIADGLLATTLTSADEAGSFLEHVKQC